MIRAVIIDDESTARNSLRGLIEGYCDGLIIVAEADSVETGIAVLKETKPDLLFLDVRLRRQTGFELLKSIEAREFQVIFTTAYDQYALKAIKVAAIDYLLKPINIDELREAIAKVEVQLGKQDHERDQRMDVLLGNQIPGGNSRIILPTFKGFVVRDVPDILYLEADGSYTTFHFRSHPPLLVSKSIGEYAEALDPMGFFRAHASFLINLQEVEAYTGGRGGTITMSDGKEISLAYRRKQEFMQLFNRS